MDQKSLSKKISYIIITLLLLEVLVFAGWYFTQPTYKATVLSMVKEHESPDQSYYFQTTSDKVPSINSVYNALSIYASLNESISNKDKLTSYILGNYNDSTGLFSNKFNQ